MDAPLLTWPRTASELEALQVTLALDSTRAPLWRPDPERPPLVGAVFFASATTGARHASPGEPAWAAAVVIDGGKSVASRVESGEALASYVPGLLALREGPLLERVARSLKPAPDVLLVTASGRDHPRRAGLAIHLGAVLGLPTVGVTDRSLLAEGAEPAAQRGSSAPVSLEGEVVGFRVRTRRGTRPIVAHAGWRTDPETAREVVLAATARARTPEPLRRARFLARVERAREEGRLPPGRRERPLTT